MWVSLATKWVRLAQDSNKVQKNKTVLQIIRISIDA